MSRKRRSWKRQMREINNYIRDRVASEISSKITAWNGKVNRVREIEKPDRGSWTNGKTGKMSFREARGEIWEKRCEINEEVQWPVSGERLARQNAAVTRIDMGEKVPVRCWYREKKSNVFVLKWHFYWWQVKSYSLQFY